MNKTLEKIKKRGIIININIKTIARTRQIIKYLKRESSKWCEFESKDYLLSPKLSCKAEPYLLPEFQKVTNVSLAVNLR